MALPFAVLVLLVLLLTVLFLVFLRMMGHEHDRWLKSLEEGRKTLPTREDDEVIN